jgi:hypothetical protein
MRLLAVLLVPALLMVAPALAAPPEPNPTQPGAAASPVTAPVGQPPVKMAPRAGPGTAGSMPAAAADGLANPGSRQQVFDFEGDIIETEFLRPNSALVETVKKRAGLSLVRIKTSFLDKILSTVDEL